MKILGKAPDEFDKGKSWLSIAGQMFQSLYRVPGTVPSVGHVQTHLILSVIL